MNFTWLGKKNLHHLTENRFNLCITKQYFVVIRGYVFSFDIDKKQRLYNF